MSHRRFPHHRRRSLRATPTCYAITTNQWKFEGVYQPERTDFICNASCLFFNRAFIICLHSCNLRLFVSFSLLL
uniref:Uncharacterized protein n=1 Tax=Sinocyclocheilus anshuiensis TaxID=1608454 RepID=A0A671M687_9TELE